VRIGSKFWAIVASSKWFGHIYGEGTLLHNLMKITIAEGLDSDIIGITLLSPTMTFYCLTLGTKESAASVLANLSAHGSV